MKKGDWRKEINPRSKFFSSLYEELNLFFWLKVNEALIHHYCEIFLVL